MGEETTIMGTVLSVVFQNEENGYAVLRLVTDDGELLTLVGCVPCAAPGENLTATGSFSSHPQYGEQFSASEVERYLPSNETDFKLPRFRRRARRRPRDGGKARRQIWHRDAAGA